MYSKKANLKEAKKVINIFSDHLYNLYMDFDLSMILKTHIKIHHYMYFFKKLRKQWDWQMVSSMRVDIAL